MTRKAETLFHSTLLSRPNAPVLLEDFHSRFTPAFTSFRSLLDPPNVEYVLAECLFPFIEFSDRNIRFNYNLAGGALMD